jgi:hypothetical protein
MKLSAKHNFAPENGRSVPASLQVLEAAMNVSNRDQRIVSSVFSTGMECQRVENGARRLRQTYSPDER